MKRYNIGFHSPCGEEMVERENGDWVQWDEIAGKHNFCVDCIHNGDAETCDECCCCGPSMYDCENSR